MFWSRIKSHLIYASLNLLLNILFFVIFNVMDILYFILKFKYDLTINCDIIFICDYTHYQKIFFHIFNTFGAYTKHQFDCGCGGWTKSKHNEARLAARVCKYYYYVSWNSLCPFALYAVLFPICYVLFLFLSLQEHHHKATRIHEHFSLK